FYDNVARLSNIRLVRGAFALDSHAYSYDLASERTQQVFTSASDYVNYTYDPIGQLTIADSVTNTEDRGYFYDAAWNLNRRTNNGASSTFTVDTKNELTNAPAGTLTYDSNGNLLTANNAHNAYGYDDENRLVEWVYYQNGSSNPI